MPARRESGLTLLEIAIATLVLSLIGGGVFAVLRTGVDTYGLGATHADVERQAVRVLDQIRDEISQSGADVLAPRLSPPHASPQIALQKNLGFAEGQVVWGTVTVIEFQHAPDDPDDGVDNNHNGLIDEGYVMYRSDVGTPLERQVVLARFVPEYMEGEIPNGKDDNGNGLIDEPGLCFDVVGEVWTVRLTVERREPGGRIVTHSVQTSIKTRN